MTLLPSPDAQAQNAAMAMSIRRSEERDKAQSEAQRLRKLVGRMLTGIRVLRTLLKAEGLGGVDVADELIEEAEKEA